MPPAKKFVPAPEHFSDPGGICSLAVAKQAGVRYADSPAGAELVPLVVSGSPLALAKVKLSFGHQVTKASAQNHGSSNQFYSAPLIFSLSSRPKPGTGILRLLLRRLLTLLA